MEKEKAKSVPKTLDEKIEEARNLAMFFAFVAVFAAAGANGGTILALAKPTSNHIVYAISSVLICGSSASLVVHYGLQWVGLQFGKFAAKQ